MFPFDFIMASENFETLSCFLTFFYNFNVFKEIIIIFIEKHLPSENYNIIKTFTCTAN